MGFYGNLANVARTTFSFDKTYSTHFEMVLKEASDQVFVGRYALLDYDYRDEKDDGVYKLVQIVEWLRTNHLGADWEIVKKSGDIWEEIAFSPDTSATQNKSITLVNGNYYIVVDGEGSFENPLLYRCDGDIKTQIEFGDGEGKVHLPESISNWYKSHYQIDEKIFNSVGRGWDSTVWQKTYKGDNLAYVMIAELNGVVPTIEILNDPPIWLSGIEIPDENTNPDEYNKYDYRVHHMAPYFDEEDKTNLYYRLHMQSPWKFGDINVTGLKNPEEGAVDGVSLSYTSSEKEYSYEIGKTGTAIDTINFDFALPSIGEALKTINILLYGSEDGNKTIDPARHYNSESGVNNICYFPSDSGNLNPDAFKSIAGALNSVVDFIGIDKCTTDIVTFKDSNTSMIYYGTYQSLIDNGISKDDIVNNTEYAKDTNNHYWFKFEDIDNNNSATKYKELEGYPKSSLNQLILDLNEFKEKNLQDLYDDLSKFANTAVGAKNSILVLNSDYQYRGVTLNGDEIINIGSLKKELNTNNYLSQGYSVGYQLINNGVKFTVLEDKKIRAEVENADNRNDNAVFNITTSAFSLPELGNGESYFLKGCNFGKPLTNSNDQAYIKLYNSNGEVDAYNGAILINGNSWDGAQIVIENGANIGEYIIFSPAIVRATSIENANEISYDAYDDNYKIDIVHKKIDKNNIENPVTDVGVIYVPTIDDYGHVTELSKRDPLPNYYSKILLRDSNIEDQKIYLTASSIGDELNLAKIQGMNFSADGNDLIFRPTVDVSFSTSEPIFQDQTANIGNEATWRKFTVVTGIGFDSDKLALDVKGREIPFPLSHISVAPRPTLETESGAKAIDFDWSNIASTGIQPTGIYEPEYRAYSPEEGVKIPSRIVSFAPADDIIKLGIWQDSSRIDSSSWWDVRRVLIGHGKPEGLKSLFNENSQNLLVGEINNLFYRQTSRIPELVEGVSGNDGQEIPKWRTNINDFFTTYPKITEKINLTKADDAENGVFSTLSLKVDKSGHIVGLQEINVKLIFNNILNNFMAPKAISPFVTKYFHNEPVAEDGYGYGAYCIGDRIYLNENESIYNYLYIGIRSGVNNASPGGAGIKMDYFPSSQVVTQHPIQIMCYCSAATYMISLKWFKEEESGAEYFEVVGNTSFYVLGQLRKVNNDGSVSNTFNGEFRAAQGVREYADDSSSNTTKESTFGSPVHTPYAVVSADQDMHGNKKSWLKESTAWLKRYAPGSTNLDKDIEVHSPYDTSDQYWNAASTLRAATTPGLVGVRRIFGIGNLSALSDSDAIKPDVIDEEAMNQDISQQESNYYDGGNNDNSGE